MARYVVRNPLRRIDSSDDPGAPVSRLVDADAVAWAYRLILQREPDPEGAAQNLFFFEGRQLVDMVLHFLSCAEFRLSSLYRRTINFEERAPVQVALDGYSIWAHPDDSEIGGEIVAGQEYEPHVTGAVRACLGPGDTLVDVGANIGWFTLLGSSIVGPTGHVVAIEPNPGNLVSLHNSIIGNGFTWTEILPYAVGSEVTTLRLLAGRGTNAYFDIAPTSVHDGWRDGAIVPVRPLDDLLGHLDRVDLVKVDVEGAEGLVVDGAARVLGGLRPTLLCEFSPGSLLERSGRTGDRFVDQLIGLGYDVAQLTASGERVALADGAAAMAAQAAQGGTHIDLWCEHRQGRASTRLP